MLITELFVKADLAKSKKEAKRLIAQRSLKIGDVVIDDPTLVVTHVDGKVVIGKYIDGGFLVHEGCLKK